MEGCFEDSSHSFRLLIVGGRILDLGPSVDSRGAELWNSFVFTDRFVNHDFWCLGIKHKQGTGFDFIGKEPNENTVVVFIPC